MDPTELCDRALLLRARGRLREAVDRYARALAEEPSSPAARRGLAAALTDLGTEEKLAGDREAGIQRYERALALHPEHVEALYNLGVAWMEEGRADRAVFFFESAVRLDPRHAEALNNLGILERERGNDARAEEHYLAALRVRASFPEALNNLALIRIEQGRAAEAVALLGAAVEINPSYALAHDNLGVAQADLGELPAALESYRRCLEIEPDRRAAQHNLLTALNYLHAGDDPSVDRVHRAWGRRFGARYPELPPPGGEVPVPLSPPTRDPPYPPAQPARGEERRLVVGYVSSDLFTHSVSYFVEAPIRHHDPSRVEVIIYASLHIHDGRTRRLRRAAEDRGHRWREVGHLTDDELAHLIQADRVDILVELTGHMAGNRLGCMAMRPAPVQVTWIGYPRPTGLDRIDHFLTDERCAPPAGGESGELVRLPGCFLCYTPPDDPPEVSPLPALENGFVTFGCFNNLSKVTGEVMEVWAKLLSAVPGSRLLLKSRSFGSESGRRHVLEKLASRGVEPARVDLLPRARTTREHLALYGRVDISLDPWPYAGATTTCESLLMGVPCVTMRGSGAAQNVGLSLLSAAELDGDWVAASPERYVAIAQTAAGDLSALSRLRGALRGKLLASPLCDGPRFVAELEEVYRRIWNHRRDAGEISSPPRAPEAPAETGGEPTRLSRAPIWERQRRFFEQQGVEAWRAGTVPHYVTSNPFTAGSYARVALAFIEDQLAAGAAPVHVVELGAGPGRFSLGFLRHLVPALSDPPRVRYLMTDVAPANIEFWQRHEAFRPFVEAGLLDFACFDLEADTALRPLHGGALEPGCPVVLIANYVFDGVRCDAFHCRDGRLYESVARLRGGEGAPAGDPFSGVEIEYQRRPVEGPYYERPDWDALLDHYRARLEDGSFLFPTAALACVERFRALAGGRLLVLSADKGYPDLAAIEGRPEPAPTTHGSISLPVNYHALGLDAVAKGGDARCSDRREGSLVVSASLFGEGATPWIRTRRALAELLDGFGPSDFFAVKKALERTAGALGLDQMLAYLRLSRWDARIFDLFRPHLESRLASASAQEREAWSEAFEQVWAHYLSLGEEHDVAQELARLAEEIGFDDQASAFHERSLRLRGR